MTTFSSGGRDLSGWKTLLDLHESIYAKTELTLLEGTILYDTQMPSVSPDNPIDLRAGTSIYWEMDEDALDHHWEMRRMDRLSPTWRQLLPSDIDMSGNSDAECWIEVSPAGVVGVVHRNVGDEDESTLKIRHLNGEDGWRTEIEVSFVWDSSASDALSIQGDAQRAAIHVERHGWRLHGDKPIATAYDSEAEEMRILLPSSCLSRIDKKDDLVDENESRS